jgi:hypothetical protein
VKAHPLANEPLDPITNDRVPYFLGDGDAESSDKLGILSFSCKRENVATVQLLAISLNFDVLGTPTEPHLLRDAASHLFLGDGHRDALATLCAAAPEHLATSAGLFAGTEAVRPFAALVMRLIRALHGNTPGFAERDRYSTASGVSSEAKRSRNKGKIAVLVSLPSPPGFEPLTGVQLLSILSCRVETPSATYAKLSPVDNSF